MSRVCDCARRLRRRRLGALPCRRINTQVSRSSAMVSKSKTFYPHPERDDGRHLISFFPSFLLCLSTNRSASALQMKKGICLLCRQYIKKEIKEEEETTDDCRPPGGVFFSLFLFPPLPTLRWLRCASRRPQSRPGFVAVRTSFSPSSSSFTPTNINSHLIFFVSFYFVFNSVNIFIRVLILIQRIVIFSISFFGCAIKFQKSKVIYCFG